jgi:hypothetical protein
MRLSTQFLQLISDHVLATPRRLRALAKIDPKRIYVENIRAVVGSNTWIAKLICDTAVRQGIFKRKIQVMSRDGAVALTVSDHSQIPEHLTHLAIIAGDLEEVTERTDEMDLIEFYELYRRSA